MYCEVEVAKQITDYYNSLFETWDAPDFLDELISKRNLENLMYLLSRVRLSKIDCIPVTVTVGYEV